MLSKPSGRLWLVGFAAALPLLSLTVQAQSSITNGLVAYWNFDNNDFKDSIGKYDGTPNGASPIQFVAGMAGFGQAMQLNGVDQMVEITGRDATYSADDLAFAGGTFSLSVWFTVGTFDKSWQALVAKGEDGNWRIHRRGGESGMAFTGGPSGDTPTGTKDVNDGAWHHLVAITDAAAANFGTALYMDGEMYSQLSAAQVLNSNGRNMMIGENPDARNRYWNGLVDDLAIWNRVLTEAEIKALYNNGTGKELRSFFSSDVSTANDGIPDWWKIKYGFNVTDTTFAAKDFNGNGIKNLDEFKLGLDPTDTNKPTVVSALANATFDKVVFTFSKNIYTGPTIANDARGVSAATNIASYSISPALAVTGVTASGNTITLSTAKQTPGATAYTLTVSNVKDVNNWPVPSTKVFYSYIIAKTPLNSGLRAYWNFDNKDFKDSAGGFDGTPNGTSPITFVAGKTGFGQAIQLDGTDQYVLITGGKPDDLAFPNGSLSVGGWFTVGGFDKSWQALIAKGEGSNWRVHRNAGNPTMAYAGGVGEGPNDGPDVTDGNWHHFMAVSDATALNFGTCLYIDGKPTSVNTSAPKLATNGQRVMIGENPDARNRYWNGQVDDLAIWDRVLSTNEINALYNNGTGKPVGALLTSTTDIPAPADGAFLTRSPAPNSKNVMPYAGITIVHSDGKTPWTATNVTMKLDGAPVIPTFTKAADRATLSFTPSALLASATNHTITLNYLDPGGQPAVAEWTFTTIKYSGMATDKVKSYQGLILGNANFTGDAKGVTGKAGDYALDLTTKGGPMQVTDANFMTILNAATANDEMSVSMWIKKYDIANSSAIWFSSPSQARVFQAHTPWSNNQVYFDTAGCCGGTQRINQGIDQFPGYTGDIGWWTNNWHLFAFTKKADQKNIYIDGQPFLNGSNTGTLSTDINQFNIGADNSTTGGLMHGLVDDVAVYAKELSQANVTGLKNGTKPSALPATVGLIAYWDFNDPGAAPVAAPKLMAVKSGANVVISWTTTAGLTLKSTASLTKPITWTAVSQTPTTSGSTTSVSVPIGAGAQFFQLSP